ncbi:MAG: MFS transporter [Breznakia sp.]
MNRHQTTHMRIFLLFMGIEMIAANIAHPITPTLMKNLHMPDYMFGLAYAGMAFTNFLFSPFWAKMVSNLGSRITLLVCCMGYGFGQFLFMISSTTSMILVARLVSGSFVAGILVSFLTYTIHFVSQEERGKYLAYNATVSSVASAFGYVIGGFVGVVSIHLTFFVQVVLLISSAWIFFFYLKDDRMQERKKVHILKEANPLKAFMDAKNFMNVSFMLLFAVVFFTSFATTTYDQSFNYFIKDIFNFSSAYNGVLKAIVGLVSFVANTTLCLWLMRNTDVHKSLMAIFIGASLCLFGMYLALDRMPFMIINLIFFAFNAMYVPLIQSACAKAPEEKDKNQIMGFYNSMKGLGMIAGGIFAGVVYGLGARLPFLFSGIFFVIACMLMFLLYRYTKVEA